MDTIDIRQMRLFVAAYEESNFSRAAAREHCTQPGLSAQMKQLETDLAQQLFHRTARGVTATVAGHQFYAACVEVLDTFTGAKQRMLDLADKPAGSIRIALPPALCKCALSWVLPDYMRTYPNVNISIQEGIVGELLAERLLSGDLEAAIVTSVPKRKGLKASHFFSDQLVVVRRETRTRPSRRMGPGVPVHELRKMKLILPSKDNTLRQIVDRVARLADGGTGQLVEIDGVLGKIDLVRNTDWATVLPRVAVVNELGRGALNVQPLVEPNLTYQHYLVHAARSTLPTACRNLLDQLRIALKQLRGVAS